MLLYRAVDWHDQIIRFLLAAHRDKKAALCFFSTRRRYQLIDYSFAPLAAPHMFQFTGKFIEGRH